MKPTIADRVWDWVLPVLDYLLPVHGDYRNPLRWSYDDDWWIGPFTFSRSRDRALTFIVSSCGDGEDNDRPANLRITVGRSTFIMRLPNWLVPGPTRTWRISSQGAEHGSWLEVHHHEYGFSVSGSGTVGGGQFLQVKLGRSTFDSATDRSWSCFLPWTTWRHVRTSFYDLEGKLFETVPQRGSYYKGSIVGAAGGESWLGYYDIQREIESRVPKVKFRFADYDGQELVATCHIEEMEWRFGEKAFKWLAFFRRPLIKRSLDIMYSDEVGRRKGTYKGGTIGCSQAMERGPDGRFWEGALGAFLRHCNENELTFLGLVDDRDTGPDQKR